MSSVLNKQDIDHSGVFWLASYPKSGNTWVRSFIKGLLIYQQKLREFEGSKDFSNESDELFASYFLSEGIDINDLATGDIASSHVWVANILGFDISDLTHDQIDQLRPAAYQWYAKNIDRLAYHKMHDAYTYLPNGEPLLPNDAITGVLCVIRNPFDVAISYAHHSGISINTSIKSMGSYANALSSSVVGMTRQLRQKLLGWSGYVKSWEDATGFQKKTVRYEDMQQKPLETFISMANFLMLPDHQNVVQTVLNEISIQKFQKQEAEKNFVEKSRKAQKFFRKGIVGDWQDVLSSNQIRQLINDHHEMMRFYGYLDEYNCPTALICKV